MSIAGDWIDPSEAVTLYLKHSGGRNESEFVSFRRAERAREPWFDHLSMGAMRTEPDCNRPNRRGRATTSERTCIGATPN